MNSMEIAKYHGYPFSKYKTASEDGYQLELHRVPGKRWSNSKDASIEASSENSKKTPVLILHGVGGSSHYWLVSGPGLNLEENNHTNKIVKGKSIVYQLADTNKYDVWILNNRGNRYSRNHMWLDPDTQNEFWNFSFE